MIARLCAAVALAAALMVPAHAQETTLESVVTSPTTFAVCKAADVASTIYLINSGIGSEANGIVAWMNGLGLGWAPFVAFSYGIYWLIDSYGTPESTAAANVVTCGVAAHNLMLIP